MGASASPRRDPKTDTWGFVVDLEPDATGRRRQARRRGFKTKREAQEELDNLRVSAREGSYVAPKRQTFGRFLVDDWLPSERTRLEPSTWESYERNLRTHVIPAIGGIPIQSLDPARLNRLYADLLTQGRRNGKGGLSGRTVRYIHSIIGASLADAVRWGRVVRNVATLADPPTTSQTRPPEMRTWDRQTLARFLASEENHRHHPAWLFLATTGCRRGECLGLRWKDLDLETGRASIRQTVTAVGDELRIAPRTKTGRARLITLDTTTVAALRSWRVRQAAERLAFGAGYRDYGLVFSHIDGRPFHPKRFSRLFGQRLAREGLPRIRLHDLRHTWATLALEAGVDLKVVAERLGNSVTICATTYQHVTPAMATDAAERVAGLIFGA